jgi:hypothetical protein
LIFYTIPQKSATLELLVLDCPNCSRWIAKSNAQQGGRGFGNLGESGDYRTSFGTMKFHKIPESLIGG